MDVCSIRITCHCSIFSSFSNTFSDTVYDLRRYCCTIFIIIEIHSNGLNFRDFWDRKKNYGTFFNWWKNTVPKHKTLHRAYATFRLLGIEHSDRCFDSIDNFHLFESRIASDYSCSKSSRFQDGNGSSSCLVEDGIDAKKIG